MITIIIAVAASTASLVASARLYRRTLALHDATAKLNNQILNKIDETERVNASAITILNDAADRHDHATSLLRQVAALAQKIGNAYPDVTT